MVTLADLEKADPVKWKAAADGWLALVQEATTAANDLRSQGVLPLAEHWQDQVGQAAGQKLADQANALEAAADIMRGVVMVLDGFAHSLEYARQTVYSAAVLAARYGLQLDLVQGCVVVPDDAPTLDHPDQVAEVNRMLTEAWRQADQADTRVAAELDKLAADTGVTDLGQALDVIQGEASNVELAAYAGDIPDGSDPKLVAEWWNGLNPDEQQQFMRSEPVAIANLNGIPDSVKAELRGTDGKYDRVAFVQYALAHWNDGHGDVDGEDNCTNFTSNALHEAGMQYKGWNTFDSDGWGQSMGGEGGWDFGLGMIAGWEHTDSWSAAQNLHDFLTGNGGQEVTQDQVKPGDILFFQQANNGKGDDIPQGQIHHTAIVTAVTPDGDIRYTQHSDPRLNVSLSGRTEHELTAEGSQQLHFVRPQPNWY
ncbi:amidase domain-containing protein [Kitasatospora azatica]|uniref:amidase domain-containing protein n=1 Tax=Kitasatospora azatica TaxID=58347 RepID=UPI000563212A|nr:amidase domain-containing protein [Kitasatospora azatica]